MPKRPKTAICVNHSYLLLVECFCSCRTIDIKLTPHSATLHSVPTPAESWHNSKHKDFHHSIVFFCVFVFFPFCFPLRDEHRPNGGRGRGVCKRCRDSEVRSAGHHQLRVRARQTHIQHWQVHRRYPPPAPASADQSQRECSHQNVERGAVQQRHQGRVEMTPVSHKE